ncbi:MAG: SDR family oxidoreductase, partial [Burkholderiaceae bacterium]
AGKRVDSIPRPTARLEALHAVLERPFRRSSQPEDVAQAAAFLASDDAAFISGVAFPVDGARTV